MAESLEPAAHQFVIHLARASASLPEQIAGLGRVTKLDEDQSRFLLEVESRGAAKESWRSLTRQLGEAAFAYPVLLDRQGMAHYPTGEVTVRFRGAPAPGELQEFAARHQLRLLRANEYTPLQFVLEPLDRADLFLPDLVARLAGAPGVHSAWANTVSRYRKAAR